jgi:opacity protein-like surface antigen
MHGDIVKHRYLTLAAILLAPLAAGAAQPQFYVGVHAGANNLSSWPAEVDFGAGVRTAGRASLDSGGHFGLMLGRQTENARFELEYQRGRFDLTAVELGGLSGGASGKGHYDALTVNAYRTAALAQRWTGYAGAGIGWGKATLPANSLAGCDCFPAASKGGLAWQLRAGAEYELRQGHGLFAQLTWLSLPRSAGGSGPSVEWRRRGVASVNLGYRAAF